MMRHIKAPTTYEETCDIIMSHITNKSQLCFKDNIVDSLNHGFENKEIYKEILKEVLKDKPKRVVDIGSNINQYAYLFTNEGIQYIGIDWDANYNTITYENCIFIAGGYEQVKEWFKDDVIISNLCVGFFIKPEDVLCKKLILGENFIERLSVRDLLKKEDDVQNVRRIRTKPPSEL